MAKKKKSKRNRNFSHSNKLSQQIASKKSSEEDSSPTVVENQKSKPASKASPKVADKVSNTGFLAHDLKTIGFLALTAVGLELVLWFLLQHTVFGNRILGI